MRHGTPPTHWYWDHNILKNTTSGMDSGSTDGSTTPGCQQFTTVKLATEFLLELLLSLVLGSGPKDFNNTLGGSLERSSFNHFVYIRGMDSEL